MFCIFVCINFVYFLCQELSLVYVHFFSLSFFSSKIFNFTDVSFYYVLANRQFRYPTSLQLENTEKAIKNGQSREIGNIGYTRRRKTKQKHNTIFVGRHYAQTNTKNVNKTRALLQTIGGKDEPNIVFMIYEV